MVQGRTQRSGRWFGAARIGHAGQRGFTLIEVLIAVAILGVLAAVTVPNVARFMTVGEVAAANTEVQNVRSAALAYLDDHGAWPPTTAVVDFSTYLGGGLRAVYTIDGDSGVIEGADTTAVSNPWPTTITFDSGAQLWQKTP